MEPKDFLFFYKLLKGWLSTMLQWFLTIWIFLLVPFCDSFFLFFLSSLCCCWSCFQFEDQFLDASKNLERDYNCNIRCSMHTNKWGKLITMLREMQGIHYIQWGHCLITVIIVVYDLIWIEHKNNLFLYSFFFSWWKINFV